VRTKQKAAVLVEQRLAQDRTEAYQDARALAIELARGQASACFDPMTAGVVLQPAETIYRQLPIWIRVQLHGRWADASFADVLMTDLRLLCRFASGRLFSLWWSGVVSLTGDLAAEHLTLDFGDGQPVNLSGVQVTPVSVAAIASTYGAQSLVGHPALEALRTKGCSIARHRVPAATSEEVTLTSRLLGQSTPGTRPDGKP
jgi:hypothetical protein